MKAFNVAVHASIHVHKYFEKNLFAPCLIISAFSEIIFSSMMNKYEH